MNRKIVSFLIIIFLTAFVGFSWIFFSSQSRVKQAENEAVKLISYDYTVKSVKRFYWTTIGSAYFSIDFIDDSGQERYAIVSQEGGEVKYYTPEQIISESDAKAIAVSDTQNSQILQTRLGWYNDQPVWEVTIKNTNNTLTYYYLSATDGAWVQKIENI